MLRRCSRGLSLALFAVCPATASAADWSAEAGATSDYRFRGLSLSGGRPAFQASVGLEQESGVYGEVWGSTLSPQDGLEAEFDATLGIAVLLDDAISADVSATYYLYPGDASANAIEWTAELEASRGAISTTLGLSIAPPQSGTRDDEGAKRTNLYAYAGVAYALVGSPVSLRAGVGFERGPWDTVSGGGKWDWSVGAGAELPAARIGLDLVGSDAGDDGLIGSIAFRF